MRSLSFIPLLVFPFFSVYSQTATENYVLTRTYKTPVTTPATSFSPTLHIEDITYFDGLGRPMQHIGVKQAGGTGYEDIVSHIGYDQYGREDKKYLPYPDATVTGGFFKTGDVASKTKAYYYNNYTVDFPGMTAATSNPFSQTRFEASPLNRSLEQGAPGKDWMVLPTSDLDHTIKFVYGTNTFDPANPTNTNNDNVRLYKVSLTTLYIPGLVQSTSSYFQAGQLYKSITKDENWISASGKNHTTEEFKDKQGRLVLKRTYANTDLNNDGDTIDSNEQQVPHDTYYVYDDYGNLTYVIPPQVNTSDGVSATELSELCYQYRYDHRNRLIEKKIPGKGIQTNWESIVYNKLDQPIMTQDPNLKTLNQWLFTKYDAFGRVVYTGLVTRSATRATLQAEADNNIIQFEERSAARSLGGTSIYYTNHAYPVSLILEVHTENYYDTYLASSAQAGITVPTTNTVGETISTATKGLPTVSKIRVLGTTNWITTVSAYEKKGRQVWSKSINPYLSTTDLVETDIDFMGNVLANKTTHSKTGNTTIVTTDNFTYDHVNRPKKHTQTINGRTEVIADNIYSKTGELISKGVGNIASSSARLQTVNYSYNIRGWLKGINNEGGSNSLITLGTGDLFGSQINYNSPTVTNKALYNGNISQTLWRTKSIDQAQRNYLYTYDALNRISTAISNDGKFDLGISTKPVTYDKNGNIKMLQRKGAIVDSPIYTTTTHFGIMDNLTYFYDSGNKLLKVADAATVDKYGFKDDAVNTTADSSNDYGYDTNGNLTSDANKGITSITYNHLNLPELVTIGGQLIDYTYDATGVKLKKEIPGKVTEYAGNFVYEKINSGANVLQFFSHPEGYVSYDGGQFNYVYNYKDHLGNVRLTYADLDGNGSISASTEILKENNYYPFGLEHKGYNNVLRGTENNHFTYNGKELEKELGLEWTDYGARRYMRDLGRWTTIDPAAQEYVGISSYSYAANNPNVFTDPDGKRLFFVGGANNDQDGWNYITRWGNFMTDAGIRNFVRVNASNGKMGDVLFTSNYRNSGYTYRINHPRNPMDDRLIRPNDVKRIPSQHNAIDRAVGKIKGNLAATPLEEGEQFNLAGYSYGSVLQAQVALKLANDGQYIDNLILIGSPISDDSDLYKQLSGNDNIGNILRVDIEGDLLSNPKDILEFLEGAYQNSSDDGPHFDLARPGEKANNLIQTVVQWLKDNGVE